MRYLIILSMAVLTLSPIACTRIEPLQLNKDNPRYLCFRGKPTILITSAEHYGAVLNADFDNVKYLDALAAAGMNHTRTWVGVYCESAGAFNIAGNTLAPAPGRFICPWARSDQPGYANGGNKFDLSRWDDAYFRRLKNFIRQASSRGIVVEVNLFCPFYTDEMWDLSPMNARNNVNGIGNLKRDQPYTLDQHGGLLAVQEALARKVVSELQRCDNIYYEVMNEPYVCKVPMEWQRHMIDVIADAQKSVGSRQLISINVANEKAKVEEPNPAVSIYNFHYAWPPEAVEMNYGLGRVIGENETGGRGYDDFYYRREGWAFILAGGGIYNNLDYSFTVGHEDGTFKYPSSQPGGGSAELRGQLRILRDFMNRLDFVRMSPNHAAVRSGLPKGLTAYALIEPGKQYAVYVCPLDKKPPPQTLRVELSLDLPPGDYHVEWINAISGEVAFVEEIAHPGGARLLGSPPFHADTALRVLRE